MDAALTTICTTRLAWHSALSADDQAKVVADKQGAMADETIKAERMAEMVATFQAADTNQDGLLDKTEFSDFMGKIGQNAGARGIPHMVEAAVDEATKEAVWTFFNGQTEGVEGVAPADVQACVKAIAIKTREMRAAM